MKKKTILASQPGNAGLTGKRRTRQGKNIIVTDHMPDWMQQYLATTGVEREFDRARGKRLS